MRTQETLTREELEHFDRDGYAFLGRVLSDAELEALQQRIDDIMLGKVHLEGARAQEYGTPPGQPPSSEWKSTLRYRKIGCLHEDDLFLAYFQKPLFRSITRHFIGKDAALQRDMLFNNYPHEGGISFHQDGGDGWNWMYEPHPIITIWTALDRATLSNGCVQVIPGSHKELIPIGQVAEVVTSRAAVPLEVEAGEAILLHNWTLHGSERNESDAPRRAVTVCYCASETLMRGQPAEMPRVFGEGAMVPGVHRAGARPEPADTMMAG